MQRSCVRFFIPVFSLNKRQIGIKLIGLFLIDAECVKKMLFMLPTYRRVEENCLLCRSSLSKDVNISILIYGFDMEFGASLHFCYTQLNTIESNRLCANFSLFIKIIFCIDL